MKILNDFADLLAKTPEAIWGVLIGSLLTLFGSWIANRHSRVLQNQQLDFERTERARERAHQLRREVYLVAAESMTRVISTLSRSVDPLFSNELLEQETAAVAQFVARQNFPAL
jgi:hypothetical protein